MLRTLDIAWLGGLLEGEGSFRIKRGCAFIQMQSTDRDVVKRATTILGMEFRDKSYKPRGPAHYKPVWGLSLTGTRAICWMMTLYQFLGERRQERVREVLTAWKASPAYPRGIEGDRLPATCHPDRVRTSQGLCRMCYMRDYRRRTGKNGSYYRNQKMQAEDVTQLSLADGAWPTGSSRRR